MKTIYTVTFVHLYNDGSIDTGVELFEKQSKAFRRMSEAANSAKKTLLEFYDEKEVVKSIAYDDNKSTIKVCHTQSIETYIVTTTQTEIQTGS